jgi:ribitol-5-phosphate 2-dehydrogenase (NADP+) / D-ribitol-5-phosphate cytidylyltransferase
MWHRTSTEWRRARAPCEEDVVIEPGSSPPPPASRTVAAVLAGGSGERMGLATPKQLLKIAGRPILEHALAVFESAPEIDEIVVMMNPGFIADAEKIVREAGLRKVTRVLPGGTSRNATTQLVLDALAHLPGERTKLLLHDAVRPLVSHEIIADSVRALDTYQAVDVAIPSADTIVEVDQDVIVAVPDRSRLRRGQTPQSFRLHVLAEAYARAWQDPDFAATDDCSVVLRYRPETPIFVVPGSERNMKVTEPLDMHDLGRPHRHLAVAVWPALVFGFLGPGRRDAHAVSGQNN